MTSYASNKREFIDIMRAENPPMPQATALSIIRFANILHDIAEGDTSSEPLYLAAEADRRTCHDCAKEYPSDRVYTLGTKPRRCREHRAEHAIRAACKPYNVEPRFDGDPRGAVVKLKVPSGRGNSFSGEAVICVPTRKV